MKVIMSSLFSSFNFIMFCVVLCCCVQVITNIDVQSIEPVDHQMRDSLMKSVQMAIEISTKSVSGDKWVQPCWVGSSNSLSLKY